jgi:peptidyl-tRNA hydrolase, PTH1 family
MSQQIQLIVGLGNPGSEYEHSRHNAGADFVTELSHQLKVNLVTENKFLGLTARTSINGKEIRLLIPTTFMNLSGQSVAALANFFKIEPAAILVAHDELDLLPGTARFKFGGGHGGHNGLRDIISTLGNNQNFHRLRLGIGHPGAAHLVSNFVLKRAPAAEKELTDQASNRALSVIEKAIAGDWHTAMQTLHTDPKKQV